nr:MtrAB system histidine kinase MtrB [Nakamurella flavida]
MPEDGADGGPDGPATPRIAEIGGTRPVGRSTRVEDLASRWRAALTFWSRSLLLRVIVVTLTCSVLVMLGLGVILQQQIMRGLLQSKVDAAVAELDNARSTAENSLAGADSDPNSLRDQLQRTVQELGRPTTQTGAQNSTAGVFEPVIIPSRLGSEIDLAVGPTRDVPAELRSRVQAGYLARQYTTVERDGVAIPALVVGTPAVTRTDSFEVYLIFLLAGEQKTVGVVQNTLLLGGAVAALALTAIAALVAFQVARPVRRAAAVARRLAAGDLGERMPVKGPIEMTTLALSFNGMAEAIRAQIRQLEEFGKLQRQFTSDVSHELRTPLTTVRMAADLLHDSREDFPPHLARSTELLMAEVDRFEILLADLLEISRHDAGMADLNAEAIDMRACVRDSVDGARGLAARAGVQIVLDLPLDPVVAEIDTRRVDRILRNLVNNAIDHAEGGTVEIDMAADADAVAVTVTDHGVGLRPGQAGLVFNRFWRADPSRQRHTGGTGLGLAISLEDAQLHGGWLQASGSPGVGARFRLTLPRRRSGQIEESPLPLSMPGTDDEPAPSDPSGPHDSAAPRLAELVTGRWETVDSTGFAVFTGPTEPASETGSHPVQPAVGEYPGSDVTTAGPRPGRGA